MDILETIEIGGGERPDGTVIWLHGLGGDGHGWEPLVAELKLDQYADIRLVPVETGYGPALHIY